MKKSGNQSRSNVLLLFFACIIVGLSSCRDKSTQSKNEETALNLPLLRTRWTSASKPLQVGLGVYDGRILWHSAPPIPYDDVFKADVPAGENILVPFRIIFRPLVSSPSHGPSRAGVMSYVGFDLIKSKKDYLYVTVKGTTQSTLFMDFGVISEDINNNGVADKEVIPDRGSSPSEWDLGLDGFPDSNEPGYDPEHNPDPNHDNWFSQGYGKCPLPNNTCNDDSLISRFLDPYDSLYYEFLNGTEGNYLDASSGGKPDREQLSPTAFNIMNAYFTASFNLTGDTTSSPTAQYVSGSDRNGWRTYRIQMSTLDSLGEGFSDGQLNPSLDKISYIRVWFMSDDSQTQPDTVQIARWRFEAEDN